MNATGKEKAAGAVALGPGSVHLPGMSERPEPRIQIRIVPVTQADVNG